MNWKKIIKINQKKNQHNLKKKKPFQGSQIKDESINSINRSDVQIQQPPILLSSQLINTKTILGENRIINCVPVGSDKFQGTAVSFIFVFFVLISNSIIFNKFSSQMNHQIPMI